MQYYSLQYFLIFLPLILLLYTITTSKKRWIVLLLASYFFFFTLSSYLIIFLLLSTLTCFIVGKLISNNNVLMKKKIKGLNREEKKSIKALYKKKSFRLLIIGVFLHILMLVGFKYTGFILTNINTLFDVFNINILINVPRIIVPIGISFFSLEAISYLIDVYNNVIPCEENIGKLALYLAYFPQIMEGPIARYQETADILYEGNNITVSDLKMGSFRIIYGLIKKMIIADRLNLVIKNIFTYYSFLDGKTIFLGAIFYTIQLYMEFSGTMDMIIGSSEMFGKVLPENFKRPFFSKNISEFWTRWHISLGQWFRNYIFYPISLTKTVKDLTKKSRNKFGNYYGPVLTGAIALFTVWLLNGLWHGAAWSYIFFGLYHFAFIMLENLTTPLFKNININRNTRRYHIFQMIKTTIIVIIGELFFRAHGLKAGLTMFKRILFNFNDKSIPLFKLGIDMHDIVIVFIFVLFIFVISYYKEKGYKIRQTLLSKPMYIKYSVIVIILLMLVIFGAYGDGYAPVDPIYANF